MSKIYKIVVGIVIILIVIFVGQGTKKSGTVKIGVIIPLTGVSADAGNYVKNGVALATEEINASSLKYKVEPIYEDSQYKNEISVSAIQKLINLDKVKYIIGEYGSSQSLAIAPIAEKNKVVMISPGTQADGLSDSGDYIFRTQTHVAQEVAYFAPVIFQKIGTQKLDIIALNTDYGISYVDDFTKSYSGLGGSVGLVQKFNATDNDFRTMLTKAKKNNKGDKANAILLLGNRKMNATMLNQAKEIGLNAVFFASSVTEGQELLEIAKENAEGLIYPYPYDDTSVDSAQTIFRTSYEAGYGKKNEMLSANSYDAMMLLDKCIESVGDSVDRVRDCLYGIKGYKGASGVLTFDDKGDVSKPFILKTVKGGRFIKD